MNREDIIRMAREAGALQTGFNKTIMQSEYSMFAHELERFAALVAAAEREACAKVCEDFSRIYGDLFANAIRERSANAGARGEQP